MELDLAQSKEYLWKVVYPYFIDIYDDLVQRSDNRELGLDKVTVLEYTQLPGILGERLFQVFDKNKNEYIDKKEFLKGMIQIYSSNLETSFAFVFNMYDFNDDGFISKEDIRLILSYVPLFEEAFNSVKEGKFK